MPTHNYKLSKYICPTKSGWAVGGVSAVEEQRENNG